MRCERAFLAHSIVKPSLLHWILPFPLCVTPPTGQRMLSRSGMDKSKWETAALGLQSGIEPWDGEQAGTGPRCVVSPPSQGCTSHPHTQAAAFRLEQGCWF